MLDYKEFAKDGYNYMRSNYSKEIAELQIRMTNMESEMKNANEMLKYNIFEKRKLTIKDIENFFNSGWFIIANVNPFVLIGKEGYAGHAVLIVGIDKNNIWLHDPGSLYDPRFSPQPNRKVSKNIFMKSLEYTGDCEVFLIKPSKLIYNNFYTKKD